MLILRYRLFVFRDIKKGSGLLQSEDEEAHLIAFTSNPKILTCVDKNEKFDARGKHSALG